MKLAVFTLTLLLAIPSPASILYSNGVDPGQHAWAVNYGYAVTNSFSLVSAAHVDQIDLSIWDVNDLNNPLTARWQITTAPFGGEVVASGESNFALIRNCQYNMELFCQWELGLPIGADLPAGDYWFQIDQVQTRWGTWAFWGQSSGASQAYIRGATATSAVPSESFVVLGD